MKTQDFDYLLPDELIAQEPLSVRDECRLLVLSKVDEQIAHKAFTDIYEYLEPGDVLVLNETRVLPARLKGKRAETGAHIEILLLREIESDVWECLVKPGKKARVGTDIHFSDDETVKLKAVILEERLDGVRLVKFASLVGASVKELFHVLGEMPLPPYITKRLDNPEMYQTVFSADEHSAAAPTAGLHFTEELLARLKKKGIEIAKVRLDVGLDTFRPVKTENAEDHSIHTEFFSVGQDTVDVIRAAKERGSRVVAVGTTAVRALESASALSEGKLASASAHTSLFILPGYEFRVVDALITNFHVPKSTLMMLVSAFCSRDLIMKAYEEAIAEQYRFLSFGDAMFIC